MSRLYQRPVPSVRSAERANTVSLRTRFKAVVALVLALLSVSEAPRSMLAGIDQAGRVTGTQGGLSVGAENLDQYIVPNVGQFDDIVRFAMLLGGRWVYFTSEAVMETSLPQAIRSYRLWPADAGHDPVAGNESGGIEWRAGPRYVVQGNQRLPGTASFYVGANRRHWYQSLPTYAQLLYRDRATGRELTLVPVGDHLLVKEHPGPKGAPTLRLPVTAGVGLDIVPRASNKTTVAPSATSGAYLDLGTFLGGSREDLGQAVDVDAAGALYVAGYTDSVDFPAPGQSATRLTGQAAFVTKFAPDGTMIHSTFLDGSGIDRATTVAVDALGRVNVGGITTSGNLPVVRPIVPEIRRGGVDGFLARLDVTGEVLELSSPLGGSSVDTVEDLAALAEDRVIIVGNTGSADFPTFRAAYPEHGGDVDCEGLRDPCGDAYAMLVDVARAEIVYSTFLGGERGDAAMAVVAGSGDNVVVGGFTNSERFPTVAPLQPQLLGGSCQYTGIPAPCTDAFVTGLDADGQVRFSTYLGGHGKDLLLAMDAIGDEFYASGSTESEDFPVRAAAQPTRGAGTCQDGPNPPFPCPDAFVFRLSGDGSALLQSTYLGGSDRDVAWGVAADSNGNAWVVGWTLSADFPTRHPYQAVSGGMIDSFVSAIAGSDGRLLLSSYLGGQSRDVAYSVATAPGCRAVVTGQTSSPDFPTTDRSPGPSGRDDAFVARLTYGMDGHDNCVLPTPTARPDEPYRYYLPALTNRPRP